MKMNRSSVVLEYQLVSNFNEVRKRLLSPEFADRLDKPLAYWALPSDRSSPIALMGRTLRELLNEPFEELIGTPGIGQKKIKCLIDLLNRAARPQPPGAIETPPSAADNSLAAEGGPVDTSLVSEALWVQWQQTVRDHGLGSEALGRYAPSLERLPRVIWNTPLDAYTELTLAQIRALKTHGEKRVRAVLEVFGSLHAMLAGVSKQSHLTMRILPSFVGHLEDWTTNVLHRTVAANAATIRQSFVDPLMAQVQIDAGDQIVELVESRLRLDGTGATVRQVARRMGLTRARVYQLLADVAAVMSVRWPEGVVTVHNLRDFLRNEINDAKQLELFDGVVELFFPDKRQEGGFTAGGALVPKLTAQSHAG